MKETIYRPTIPRRTMLSIEEWRKLLGQENLTDEEVAEFAQALRNFLGQLLDEYLRAEFEPDDV